MTAILLILFILLVIVAVFVGLVCLGAKDDEDWKLAMDIADINRTGKVGSRSNLGKKYQAKQALANLNAAMAETIKAIEQSKSAPYQYRYDPTSGYTDMRMGGAFGNETVLDAVDFALDYLKMETDWRDIDHTAMRYMKELKQYGVPGAWDAKMEKTEKFMEKMNDSCKSIIGSTNSMIESAYKTMGQPDANIDPAYRKAFEAKVNEWRQFMAIMAR